MFLEKVEYTDGSAIKPVSSFDIPMFQHCTGSELVKADIFDQYKPVFNFHDIHIVVVKTLEQIKTK